MSSTDEDLPRAPDGVRVYAIGDIHGRDDLLERLLARIEAEPAGGVQRRELVFLGDYVDRGPASRGVLDRLIHSPPQGFGLHFLKGNHEAMLLNVLDGREQPGLWFVNGGLETAESYGIVGDWADLEIMVAELREAVPGDHVGFLRTLQLHARFGDYVFVHAGFRPGVALAAQSEADMLWIRDSFLYADADFGACVVHGHSPVEVPEVLAKRIGIDTRAWQSGVLTALVLEGEERRFLST